jgi:hypothetical protein
MLCYSTECTDLFRSGGLHQTFTLGAKFQKKKKKLPPRPAVFCILSCTFISV